MFQWFNASLSYFQFSKEMVCHRRLRKKVIISLCGDKAMFAIAVLWANIYKHAAIPVGFYLAHLLKVKHGHDLCQSKCTSFFSHFLTQRAAQIYCIPENKSITVIAVYLQSASFKASVTRNAFVISVQGKLELWAVSIETRPQSLHAPRRLNGVYCLKQSENFCL